MIILSKINTNVNDLTFQSFLVIFGIFYILQNFKLFTSNIQPKAVAIYQTNNKEIPLSQQPFSAKAQDLARKFMFAKTKSAKWRRRGHEAVALANNDIEGTGTQLTQAELDALKKRYGIPLSLNIIPAVTENLQAFISNAVPSIDVVPIGKANKHYAYVWRDTCKGTLHNNKFKQKQNRAVKDMVQAGLGVLHVRPNNFFSHNEFNCVIQAIPWYYVYIDPNSVEPDFEDAEYIFVAYPMPITKAQKIWGLTEEDMKYASSAFEGGDASDGGYSRDLASSGTAAEGKANIWVIEAFEKEIHTLYIDDNGVRSFTKPEIGNPIAIKAPYINRSTMLGRFIKDSQLLAIDKYPFGFYQMNHNYNPMCNGITHLIMDVQYAVNKFVALLIENMQKGSNFRWLGASGSVQDVEKFEQDASRPGALLEYDANPNLQDGGRPVAQQPMPLPSAYFTMVQTLIELSKYITGVHDLNQGNASNAPNTVGATQSIQAAGAQRPKMYTENTDFANQQILEVMIQYLQAYAPQENIMRYVESSEGFREIMMDVKSTLQDGGAPQPDEAGQKTASYVYDEASNMVKAILGSSKVGQYRVQYQSSNNTHSSRQAALGVIQAAIAGVADDNIRLALSKAMLELTDYPEVDKVLRDADAMARMQQTIQQLQEQLKMSEQSNQQLNKEVQNLERDQINREYEVKLSKLHNKLDSEVKSNIKEQKEEKKAKVYN